MVKKGATDSKCTKRKKKLPSRRGRPSIESTIIPPDVKLIFEELLPYFRENVPESTACALIGMEWTRWEELCARYPALRVEAKRVQAERLVEWQRAVEAGAQGWQAAATLLERRDSQNWSRSTAGRPQNTSSPYEQAMQKRRGK
jgi:hypothetical protein